MSEDLDQRVSGMMLGGTCCTQTLVQLALDETDRSDPLLVSTVEPLCGGMGVGGACGALTGGLLALSLLHGDQTVGEETVRRYVDWFRQEFGSTECRDIVEDDPFARATRCPSLVAAAYAKARELAAVEGT